MFHRLGFFVAVVVATAYAACPDGTVGLPTVGGACPTGLTVNSGVCCCMDKTNPSTGRSDCPGLTAYCNNSVYASLMLDQCAKTCGKCPIANCVDKVNPSTGVSDCARMAAYCTNADYLTLMRDQCPKTCRFC